MDSAEHYVDGILIGFSRKYALPFARFALFVIFFWFGVLKVIGESPASPMVASLLSRTMPFMSATDFIIFFGLFEMAIGLSFLFPKLVRLSILLLAIHMVTTIMPLFLVPQTTWTKFLVPTLEGQYIIKNLLIMAVALVIVAFMPTREGVHEQNKSIIK